MNLYSIYVDYFDGYWDIFLIQADSPESATDLLELRFQAEIDEDNKKYGENEEPRATRENFWTPDLEKFDEMGMIMLSKP